jgi:hypothetical protein
MTFLMTEKGNFDAYNEQDLQVVLTDCTKNELSAASYY